MRECGRRGALPLIKSCFRCRTMLSPSSTKSISSPSFASSTLYRQARSTTTTTMSAPPKAHSRGQKPSSSSPFESNILRILCNEIQYRSDYDPPRQPVKEFGRFMVEDRPGEQWITLRGMSAEHENIKIEATMFDGSMMDQESGDEGTEENLRLHISLLVDIWKEEGSDLMEFVCSAWPDSLEIQKVYIFRRDGSPVNPYMGPDIKNLNPKLQSGLYKFLKTRGVNDNLSEFMHEYMMNKDRIEHIHWLGKVQSYFEE